MSGKARTITRTFYFSPLIVEVSMVSNHRDYRIWQVWFGDNRSRQRFWMSFKLPKNIWFGPMAYYVMARTVASDLELALAGVSIGLRNPGFPQCMQLEVYRDRMNYLAGSLSLEDDVPKLMDAVTDRDTLEPEDRTGMSSLHNAQALILRDGVPDTIAMKGSIEYGLEIVASWMTDKIGFSHLFTGFRFGKAFPLDDTYEFFKMIGYYNSDFKNATFTVSRRGPKEWSPHKHLVYLERGKDYAKEDYQAGEHDL